MFPPNLSYLHFLPVADAVWKQMPGALVIHVEIGVLMWVKLHVSYYSHLAWCQWKISQVCRQYVLISIYSSRRGSLGEKVLSVLVLFVWFF